MARRAESKAAARAAKLEAMRRQQQLAQRRRTATIVAVIVAVLAAVAAVIGVSLANSDGTKSSSATASSLLSTLPGLQTGPAPWQPEYAHLSQRLDTLHLPPSGTETYHIHAHLAIYVDGKPVTVPANVGLSAAAQLFSPLHTHDATGVIHIEAARPSKAFTLGAFFDVWGVLFTGNQLGSYRSGGNQAVSTYVNGRRVANPVDYRLQPHDNIVIGYGTPGSFPHKVAFTWPPGE